MRCTNRSPLSTRRWINCRRGRIERLLYIAEYKRRQACPGVKVTLKSFGRDRRYPITNKFRDPGVMAAATTNTPTSSPVMPRNTTCSSGPTAPRCWASW